MHVRFCSIPRQLLEPQSEKGKTRYPYLTIGEAEMEHRNDCWERITQWELRAWFSLIFLSWLSSFVPKPGFSCIMMKYSSPVLNGSNFSCLFFALTPSFLFLPRFYFLLIVRKFWKGAGSSARSIHAAARGKMTLRLSGTKLVCVGTDVWTHHISAPPV